MLWVPCGKSVSILKMLEFFDASSMPSGTGINGVQQYKAMPKLTEAPTSSNSFQPPRQMPKLIPAPHSTTRRRKSQCAPQNYATLSPIASQGFPISLDDCLIAQMQRNSIEQRLQNFSDRMGSKIDLQRKVAMIFPTNRSSIAKSSTVESQKISRRRIKVTSNDNFKKVANVGFSSGSKKITYRCFICNFRTNSKENFCSHLSNYQHTKAYQTAKFCNICNSTISCDTLTDELLHMLRHTSVSETRDKAETQNNDDDSSYESIGDSNEISETEAKTKEKSTLDEIENNLDSIFDTQNIPKLIENKTEDQQLNTQELISILSPTEKNATKEKSNLVISMVASIPSDNFTKDGTPSMASPVHSEVSIKMEFEDYIIQEVSMRDVENESHEMGNENGSDLREVFDNFLSENLRAIARENIHKYKSTTFDKIIDVDLHPELRIDDREDIEESIQKFIVTTEDELKNRAAELIKASSKVINEDKEDGEYSSISSDENLPENKSNKSGISSISSDENFSPNKSFNSGISLISSDENWGRDVRENLCVTVNIEDKKSRKSRRKSQKRKRDRSVSRKRHEKKRKNTEKDPKKSRKNKSKKTDKKELFKRLIGNREMPEVSAVKCQTPNETIYGLDFNAKLSNGEMSTSIQDDKQNNNNLAAENNNNNIESKKRNDSLSQNDPSDISPPKKFKRSLSLSRRESASSSAQILSQFTKRNLELASKKMDLLRMEEKSASKTSTPVTSPMMSPNYQINGQQAVSPVKSPMSPPKMMSPPAHSPIYPMSPPLSADAHKISPKTSTLPKCTVPVPFISPPLKILSPQPQTQPSYAQIDNCNRFQRVLSQDLPNNINNRISNDTIMPWMEKRRPNYKYEIPYKAMLQPESLKTLFKCMAKRCSFSTNNVELILKHLFYHEQDKNKNIDFHLFCPYCPLKYNSNSPNDTDAKNLIHHINDVHRKELYQCAYCFYRSCESGNVQKHLEKAHKNMQKVVYEASYGKDILEKIKPKIKERLKKKRNENVMPLRCKLCNSNFFLLDEFTDHLQQHEQEGERQKKEVETMLTVLDKCFEAKTYGMFQCLYCHFGAGDEATLSDHLALHPSEFRYYCKRALDDKREAQKHNLKKDYAQKVEFTSLIRDVVNEVSVYAFNQNVNYASCKYSQLVDPEMEKMYNAANSQK